MGKYHDIEVEDEVTGYFEFDDGLVGHFITTTAESPGTNRLEIVGERGKIVFESGKLMFHRNRSSMLDFLRTSPHAFDRVENWAIDVPYKPYSEQGHRLVLENFADAIQRDAPLIAPAVEGIRSLALGNAIMLSSFLGHPVELPFDDDLYAERIAELARTSRYRKVVRSVEPMDVRKSFSGGTQ
jgi:predicted dehydrogenase